MTPQPHFSQTLSDALSTALEERGLTIEKMRQQTGIGERHLHALFRGEMQKLPAAPYVRGYLMKIGQTLGLDGQELWKLYHAELNLKHSGPLDRLPENRYALRHMDRRLVIGLSALILLALYVGINARRFLGQPELTLANPATETTVMQDEFVTLEGRVDPRDKLLVNDKELAPDKDGNFQMSYRLEPGLNTITVTARRILGRETRLVRQIIYEPPPKPSIESGTE